MNSLLIPDAAFEAIQDLHKDIEKIEKRIAKTEGALIRYMEGKEGGWGEAEVEFLESLR